MGKSTNIFLFAHQDDETGVLLELHRLVASGNDVIIVYLTSGDLSGLPSPVRDSESMSVLNKIGIPEKNVHFLGREIKIPDGQLSKHMEVVYYSVLDLLDAIAKPDKLYYLAWEGGHQDHDATHIIGTAVGNKLGMLDKCFQFTLYTGHGLPYIFFKMFSPLKDNGETYVSRIPWLERFKFILYCLSYPSQIKTWVGLLPFFIVHYMFRGTQILQPVSLSRIRKQPHDEKLLYERRGFYTYQKFADDVNAFLNNITHKN